jgi:hypothetical protein
MQCAYVRKVDGGDGELICGIGEESVEESWRERDGNVADPVSGARL